MSYIKYEEMRILKKKYKLEKYQMWLDKKVFQQTRDYLNIDQKLYKIQGKRLQKLNELVNTFCAGGQILQPIKANHKIIETNQSQKQAALIIHTLIQKLVSYMQSYAQICQKLQLITKIQQNQQYYAKDIQMMINYIQKDIPMQELSQASNDIKLYQIKVFIQQYKKLLQSPPPTPNHQPQANQTQVTKKYEQIIQQNQKKFNKKYQELQKQKEEEKQKMREQLESTIRGLEGRCKQQEETIRGLRARVAELEGQLRSYSHTNSRNDVQNNRYQQLGNKLKEKQRTIQNLNKQIGKLKQKQQKHQDQIKKIQQKNHQSVQNRLKPIEKQNKQLKQTNTKLITQINKIRSKCQQKLSDKTFDNLREQVGSLKQRIQSQRIQNKELQNRIYKFIQKQVNHIEEENRKLKSKNQSLSNQIKNLSNQIKIQKQKSSAIQEKNQQFKPEIKQLQKYKKQEGHKNNKSKQLKQQFSTVNQFLIDGRSTAFWHRIFKGQQHNSGQPAKPNFQQRDYLIETLQKFSLKKRISRTILLFQFDPKNLKLFHPYIDNIPKYLVLIKLENGHILVGYSEQGLSTSHDNSCGFIASLRLKTKIEVNRELKGSRTTTYNEFYIIFGNDELRVLVNKKQVQSHAGGVFSYFRPKVSRKELFGVDQQVVTFTHLEVYKVFFQGEIYS